MKVEIAAQVFADLMLNRLLDIAQPPLLHSPLAFLFYGSVAVFDQKFIS